MLRRGLIFIVSVVAWLLVATQIMPKAKACPPTYLADGTMVTQNYAGEIMYTSPWGRTVRVGPQSYVNPWAVNAYPTTYSRAPFGWSAGGYSATSPAAAEIRSLYSAPAVGYGTWGAY